jgi:dihydroxyacetone kinase-like predicted kinase
MVAYEGDRSAGENVSEMNEAVAAVATGAVTTASRDVELDGLSVRKGAFLGLAEEAHRRRRHVRRGDGRGGRASGRRRAGC